jgi:hypothetical protein
MTMTKTILATVVSLAAIPTWALAQMKDVPHPFILWTKAEAAEIRKRIETDPLARQQYERMVTWETKPSGKNRGGANLTLLNLFKYLVMGDQAAGEAEKKQLLGFIGKVPEPMTAEFKAEIQKRLDAVGGDWDKIWTRGNASFADRHMRDEQTMHTLRYDVLYDILTPDERAGVEKAMKAYVQFHIDGHKPWHADFRYGKMSWLPNMSWPRAIGAHLQAAALKDQKLIEAVFNSQGGWKWFMDAYLSDGRFYNEEFGKYYSNIGSMCMYAEAVEKLGLGHLGWGYTGKGGGTMKSFLEMTIWIGYPRTDMPGGMPNYRRVTMGDARGTNGLMEYSILPGYMPDGSGGETWWGSGNMNGPFQKARAPLWFEWGHKRFPDAGFDYFLAQMRAPTDDLYYPSLYMGLSPIDPKKVKAPPAPSYLAYERGFAFLRAEESPAYWEGPWPAVAAQFGFYYAHYSHDCFATLGMQAFNRPIYLNPSGGKADHYVNEHIKSGPPTGYIGRHPWADTTRGSCGVVVDYLQARPIESGEEGLKNHRMRSQFTPLVKFVAGKTNPQAKAIHGQATEPGVFPGVDMERAYMLTREYLFDLFWLSSDRPRIYDWNVHGPGAPVLDERYKPTSELNGSMLYREPAATQPADYADKYDGNDLRNVHKMLPGDAGWSSSIVQKCLLADMSKATLRKEWYDRGVGVQVSMLGESGTSVFAGMSPSASGEWGGTTLFVRRQAPKAVFVALHEPFEGGKAPQTKFARIAQSDKAVAAAVTGASAYKTELNDRLLLSFGPEVQEPQTLEGDGESFTFASHGFVRIGKDKVEVVGDVRQMSVKVEGSPQLIVNGGPAEAKIEAGLLRYAKP